MPNHQSAFCPSSSVSPLVLSDRLITLAREADRAGYVDAASRLVGMALAVFDETPRRKQLRRLS